MDSGIVVICHESFNELANAPIDRPANMKNLPEQEGFEPPVPFGTTVFKTVAFSRSATAPTVYRQYFTLSLSDL